VPFVLGMAAALSAVALYGLFVLWPLARRLAERGHPVAVLPPRVLLVGPAGSAAVPSSPTVELHFTSADLAENAASAVDRIVRELVRRGLTT